jgi:hypothetical protein
MNGANGDERHRRQSPEGKGDWSKDGEGVSIVKDEVKAKLALARRG